MSRDNFWLNSDGLKVGFGPRGSDQPEAAPIKTEGLIKQHVKLVDYRYITETDTVAAEGDDQPLRPGGTVTRAYLVVTEDFASDGGTATLDIGTKQKDGTTIDVDSFAAAVAEGTLTAGSVIELTGDIVGSTVAIDPAPYITTTWGTEAFTAGVAKMVVEYLIEPSIE